MGLSLVVAVITGVLSCQWRHTLGPAPLIAAMLWAMAVLRRRDALVIGIAGVLVRDALAGFSLFTLARIAASLGVFGVLAALRPKLNVASVALSLLASSATFHLALGVGDWVTQTCSKEPHTAGGLLSSLAGSWPYVRQSFAGEVAFAAAFISLYALAGRLAGVTSPAVATQPTVAVQSKR